MNCDQFSVISDQSLGKTPARSFFSVHCSLITVHCLLITFLLTAGVGVWAAYDREAAWVKFGLLAGGAALFIVLARLPWKRLPAAAWLAAALNAALAVYFLLTYDWSDQPADIDLINRVGVALMSVRPSIPLAASHPNIIGGILAALAPLNVWAIWPSPAAARPRGEWGKRIAAALLALVAGFGLLMTSSRAAWAALVAAGMVAGFVAFLARQRPALQKRLGAAAALLCALAVVGLLAAPEIVVKLVNALPGAASGGSRWELAQNTFLLARTFAFTGCGLDNFAGLYSQYILHIPVMLFRYAHQLYLDVALEQGVLGLLALLGILAVSFYHAARSLRQDVPAEQRRYALAVFAGLGVMALHGLVDDAFYGMRGTPLLFALPGLAAALAAENHRRLAANPQESSPPSSARPHSQRARLLIGLGLLVILVGGGVFSRQTLAAFSANIGACFMAQSQLSGWDWKSVNNTLSAPLPEPAEQWLRRALEFDHENGGASYRLGFAAYHRNDFPLAREYFEAAARRLPNHRGVKKLLGYTLVWLGEPQAAREWLEGIPEAKQQMESYANWWKTQNRPDLANAAKDMAQRLK